MSNDVLDIQDYLDATSDASSRTRNVTFVLVIASVIVLTGVLNSLQGNWMLARIVNIHVDSSYAVSKLLVPVRRNYKNDSTYVLALSVYKEEVRDLKKQFSTAAIKAFVDNSLYIRVPFFGVAFDVNDLGLFAGIGFMVILLLLNFCLTREANNLLLSFEAARRSGSMVKFYTLLAMRQVFTVPDTKYLHRSSLLVIAPKVICWLPCIVYAGLLWQDLISTRSIGDMLNSFRNTLSIIYEIIFMITIFSLSVRITVRLIKMDAIWKEYSPNTANVETEQVQ